MSEGQKPALSISGLVGRVAAFLFGAGATVMAVLTVTGDIVAVNGAGEPVTNIFIRILVGLIYGFVGLASVGAAIFGFPEESHSSRRRVSGGSGFDGDDGGTDFD